MPRARNAALFLNRAAAALGKTRFCCSGNSESGAGRRFSSAFCRRRTAIPGANKDLLKRAGAAPPRLSDFAPRKQSAVARVCARRGAPSYRLFWQLLSTSFFRFWKNRKIPLTIGLAYAILLLPRYASIKSYPYHDSPQRPPFVERVGLVGCEATTDAKKDSKAQALLSFSFRGLGAPPEGAGGAIASPRAALEDPHPCAEQAERWTARRGGV